MFNGTELDKKIREIPHGTYRMKALEKAIRDADLAKEHKWRLLFRYDYAAEACFYDDSSKALPVSLKFSSIYEEHPNAIPDGEALYLFTMEMAVANITSLPQITISQWENIMEKFKELVYRYRLGLRTWYWQACNFYAYVDLNKAKKYFEKFLVTPRDELSDCEACEQSGAVWFAMLSGDRERAVELANPIFSGKLTCSDVPQMAYLTFLEDDLNHGDLSNAVTRAELLYEAGHRDKSDLSYLGAVLRCFAFCNLEKGEEILQKYLSWTYNLWDKRKQYDFYKGAYVFCKQLSLKKEFLSLDMPKDYENFREDGIYLLNELTQWFKERALKIADSFDKRNQSSWFQDDFKTAQKFL